MRLRRRPRRRSKSTRRTAALTFTTDPSGPHAIPHLIDGVPVQIKKVNVTVNREHFTFNPTNCNPLAITGHDRRRRRRLLAGVGPVPDPPTART